MGAADVVPGVSGGTVAFITGIYEELLHSIKAVDLEAARVLLREGPAACWRHINGNFLLALALGIATSVISLARGISYLLAHHPLLLWAFFFGLIAASGWHIGRQLQRWTPALVAILVLGALAAFAVGELKPSQLPPRPSLVFASGAIAICAMILPGISGSFILVLLGMYAHVLGAIETFDPVLLGAFLAGCASGLLLFARLLSWLFRHYHDRTMAVLTGFLLGSLSLVWPWKHTLSYYTNSDGERLALSQENVWPWVYDTLTGGDPQLIAGLCLMLLGGLVVLGLEKVGANRL